MGSDVGYRYHQLGKYTQGMEVIDQLLHDVKRLDDKLLLVEIHYIEAKLFFTVRNMAKAKVSAVALLNSIGEWFFVKARPCDVHVLCLTFFSFFRVLIGSANRVT